MDWSAVESGLIDAFRTAYGDPTLDVYWRAQADGWRAPVSVCLDVISFDSLGKGEIRHRLEAGQLRQRVYHARTFRVQVTVESQELALGASAHAVADNLTASLRLHSAREALKSVDLGIASVGPQLHVNYADTNRCRSAVVFEVLFNAHSSFSDALYDYVLRIAGIGSVDSISVPFDVLG